MRTIRETIEWRAIAFAITFFITYLWTGKLLEASGLTIALNLSKTVAFYIWSKYRKGHIKELAGKLSKSGIKK
jgi:uncharacterized membrane protein